MKNRVPLSTIALLAGFAAVGASDAFSQAPQPSNAPVPSIAPAPSTPWLYPAGDRKDPVVPPPALYSGEGFPQLQVSMIAYDAVNPAASRVLVVMEGPEPIRRVATVGEWVGRYQIEGIERDRVRVLVRTLGAIREETLFPVRADAATRVR